MNLRQTGRYLLDLRERNKEKPILSAGRVSYANWWKMDPTTYWFTRFVNHYFPDLDTSVRFYSVFGPKKLLRESFDGVKVFFSGENLEKEIPHSRLETREVSERLQENRRKMYGDYGISDVQISMGFSRKIPEKIDMTGDILSTAEGNRPADREDKPVAGKGKSWGAGEIAEKQDSVYLRFPLWITYLVQPEDHDEMIRERIHAVNQSRNPVSAHGVTCISSHDFFGTRADICDGLEKAGIPIAYAGNWRNNTQALKQDFGDDKQRYLHSVRFIVCPENMDADGYVTEKLFDAFAAGAIPIYQGAAGHPEPGLINPEAVLFWDFDGDNEKVLSQVRKLGQDDAEYMDFMNQVKLTDSCADYVWNRIMLLRKYLEEALLARG